MLNFSCSACQKKLSVAENHAGQMVRCPDCGQAIAAPEGATVPPALAEVRTLPPPLPPPVEAGNAPTYPPSSDRDATEGVGPAGVGRDLDLAAFLAPPQADDELGRLGAYRVLRVLGAGGMGVVFQAYDPHLERLVALKVMLPALGGSENARQRFLREARAAAAVTHDNIVAIYQVGEDRAAPFLAMQFLEGEPLDRRLRRVARLPLGEVLRIGRETARGLAAAHQRGLIHRDVKPANLWLEAPTQRVKILDFGLARPAADAHLTQEGAIVGTPAYMAPEQARGEAVDHRADLFSLGVVLYRLCTGRQPFQAADAVSTLVAVAVDNPPSPRELRPDLPLALSDLIVRLLSKKCEGRPASALAVAEALEEIESCPLSPPAKKRLRLPWLAAGGVACLATGLLWLCLPPRDQAKQAAVERPAQDEPPPVKSNPPAVKNADPPKPEPPTTPKVVELPPTYLHPAGMEFVRVGRGKSWLGGGAGKPGEKEVVMAYDFYLGAYEVTTEEWQKVMRLPLPPQNQRRFPKGGVSWDDAQVLLSHMNTQDRAVGWIYRLPREVEWEYACRGGPMTDRAESAFDFYLDKPTNELLPGQASVGRAKGPKGRATVGSYKPNRLGLYDMHGNVWELCDDAHPDANRPLHRRMRGGCWHGEPENCRAAHFFGTEHYHKWPSLGLRVARVPIDRR